MIYHHFFSCNAGSVSETRSKSVFILHNIEGDYWIIVSYQSVFQLLNPKNKHCCFTCHPLPIQKF